MKSEVEQNTTTKKPTTQGCECSEAKRLRHIQSWQPAAPRTVLGSSSFRQVVTHTGTKSASPHFKRGALVFIKAQPHTRTQTHSHTHTHTFIYSPPLCVSASLCHTLHTHAHRHAQVIALHGASEQLIITIPVKLTLSRHPSLV